MAGVRRMAMLLCLVLIVLCCQVTGQKNKGRKGLNKMKTEHKPKTLSQNKLAKIAGLSDIDRFMGPVLNPFLQVRVPDTAGNRAVRQFIVGTLNDLGSWEIEQNSFTDNTPLGNKEFVNVIATLRNQDSTPSDLKLVLACHYDSKKFDAFTFLGATDSAVPCAMLLDLAHNLKSSLDAKTYMPYTLQLIFFDGEEAFVQWTPTDSIYGSRHLARKWQNTPHHSFNKRTVLDGIGLFVLLDLIGTANPTFKNFYPQNSQSSRMFQHFQKIERRLSQSGQLASYDTSKPYFSSERPYGGVEDDHIPFHNRGVDIVHLIAHPFPTVWHKASDNKSALDRDTISNLNKIFHVFVAEFLHLQPTTE